MTRESASSNIMRYERGNFFRRHTHQYFSSFILIPCWLPSARESKEKLSTPNQNSLFVSSNQPHHKKKPSEKLKEKAEHGSFLTAQNKKKSDSCDNVSMQGRGFDPPLSQKTTPSVFPLVTHG